MQTMPPGRPPLSDSLVDEMAELRARGLSDRQIAARLGVAHVSVARQLRKRSSPHNTPLEKSGGIEPGERYCDPPERCDQGHLCYVLPCRTCAFDRLRENQRG